MSRSCFATTRVFKVGAEEERETAALDVALIVGKNFDIFPENVRNESLIKLSERGRAITDFTGNLDNLPEDIKDVLFFKRTKSNEAPRYVAFVVKKNFDKFPEDVRNELLLKPSEKDKAAGAVALAINKNFDKFPEDVRNELQKCNFFSFMRILLI